MITYGVDVSHYQSDYDEGKTFKTHVNWKKLYDDGARFAILRASIGMVPDRSFENQLQGARDAGFKAIGAYHYLYWNIPVEKQVDAFLNTIAGSGVKRGFCDVEQQLTVGQPGSSITSVMVNKWLTYVWGNMSLIPGIYTRKNLWQQFGSKADWVKLYDLWAAWYGWTPIYTMNMSKEFQYLLERTMIPAPFPTWTFAQFSCTGAGYVEKNRPIDLDAFNGNDLQCREYFGAETSAGDIPVPEDALQILVNGHPELFGK